MAIQKTQNVSFQAKVKTEIFNRAQSGVVLAAEKAARGLEKGGEDSFHHRLVAKAGVLSVETSKNGEVLAQSNFYGKEVAYDIDIEEYSLLNSNYSLMDKNIRTYEARVYIR